MPRPIRPIRSLAVEQSLDTARVLAIGPDADQRAAAPYAFGIDVGLLVAVASFLQGAKQTAGRAARVSGFAGMTMAVMPVVRAVGDDADLLVVDACALESLDGA